jgi:hypothetical protein
MKWRKLEEGRYCKIILSGLRKIYAGPEEIISMVELIKDSNLTIENFRPGKFSIC